MKPRHTQPDENQLQIERYLQQLGFFTYRTCDLSPQKSALTKTEFHPLDLLVLGVNRKTQRVELSLWEIKRDNSASFTEQELDFLSLVKSWFRYTSRVKDIAVGIALDVDDILNWYGWTDNAR